MLRANVIEHFWNGLAVDAPTLIADILNMGRDNNVEELNKRYASLIQQVEPSQGEEQEGSRPQVLIRNSAQLRQPQ